MWSTVVLVSIIGCVVAGPPVTRSREQIESFKAFLEKSRTDDGIRLKDRMLANPKASPWENSGKFEGDILLNDEQAELLLQDYAGGRNAYIRPNTKWPGNTIVYEFDNVFNTAQINAIRAAMREIEQRTCIRFRARQAWETVFVRVTGRPDGCYASVGYWERFGVHTMNLALETPGRGCFMHNIIIHEWLHVVGFFHMQSSYNRDFYVQILWENIAPGQQHNFERYESNLVSYMGLPYEYESNMHYGRYGFTINGRPTMLPKFNDHGLMGQLDFVTGRDWHRANRHYNCPWAWSTPDMGNDGMPVEEQNLLESSQVEQMHPESPQEEEPHLD